MARSVALSVLRGRVRNAGDFGPDSATGRYNNARLNLELNASWQRAREIAVIDGDGQIYLKSAVATMTPGAVANQSFGVISTPSDFVQVHGLDVIFSGNDIASLQHISWGDRNIFRDVYGGSTGRPVGFCVISTGVESTNTVSAGQIALMPAPDQAYTYNLWYVPAWTDLVNDTDVFNGIAGHEDWAMWDTVIKLTTGDNNALGTYQLAQAERAKAEELLKRRVNKIQRVGPTQRRNVVAETRRRRMLLWRRP